jgi:uncharacterized protein YjaZ
MEKKYQIIKVILPLLLLFMMSNIVLYSQDSKHDTSQYKIIELAQGCKLVLDTKIDTTDSLSIKIITGLHDIIPQIQKLIPADSITINLAISNENILPAFGMGGGSTNNRVEFYYDPNNPNFTVEFMFRSLVHECLHVSRLRMPQWQLTLLECMITEGLADHFVIELLNGEPAKWSKALTEEQIQQYMLKLKPLAYVRHESWNAEFNEKYFNPWMFFGRKGDDPIPGWCGYSLGWRIVENYLKDHHEARASSLVFTPAEEIASSTHELVIKK